MNRFHDQLSHLVTETAADVERRAAADGLVYVNERDHLQKSCASAAKKLAPQWTPPAQLSTLRLPPHLWPRLGGIDIALTVPGEKPVAVELKCGRGLNALGYCAWDALKLAFALRTGEISAAYLLAATPASDWNQHFRGSELFDRTTIDTLDLRERFIDWWAQWEREGYRPANTVPRHFTTRPVCHASFQVAQVPWVLRLATLSLEGDEQIAWPTTLA